MVQTPEEKRESRRAASLRWFHANREKALERKKARYPKHREKHLAACRIYNADEANVARRKDSHYRRKFGLTLEQYDAMFEAQGRQCASGCGRPNNSGRRWPVDHCHASGKVRAILCHNCNVALGNAHDDPEILRKLIAYLEHHKIT